MVICHACGNDCQDYIVESAMFICTNCQKTDKGLFLILVIPVIIACLIIFIVHGLTGVPFP